MTAASQTLDEAYERLHATGPEFDGWLSNHGPMVAEAMVRNGHADRVEPWLDRYVRRLEEMPPSAEAIGDDWESALGDPRRIGDWTGYFEHEASELHWQQLLGLWWPRLIPGVAAAATHGVIRVGHIVRQLLEDGEDDVRILELAHGLAYWAARWQPVPGADGDASSSRLSASTEHGESATLSGLPRIAEQTGGIRERLDRLGDLASWPAALRRQEPPSRPDDVPGWLGDLVDEAASRYLRYGHGNAVMLVHSATAPNAILRALPALDADLWLGSAAAAWTAAAALTAVYAPREPAPAEDLPEAPRGAEEAEETFARAVEHGDEHAIKFADTALDSYRRSNAPEVLAAAVRATLLIGRPG